MPAVVTAAEVRWGSPVRVQLGSISGLTSTQSLPAIRKHLQAGWPKIRRAQQCVYIIRLLGDVSIDYPRDFSPVIYIGEGNAYRRLYQHAGWLAPLVTSVKNTGVEIHIAEVVRRNRRQLYKHVEADLLRWFVDIYGSLPWFNRQRESSMEGRYSYDKSALRSLKTRINRGSGHTFLWAIKPTYNNYLYEPYAKGMPR